MAGMIAMREIQFVLPGFAVHLASHFGDLLEGAENQMSSRKYRRFPSSLLQIALGLLFCWPLSSTISHAAGDWQTTDFKVSLQRPDIGEIFWQGDGRAILREGATLLGLGEQPSSALIQEIEAFLHETAVLYERWGYPDPVASGWLKPVVSGDDGNDAVQVYLYDIGEKLGAYYNDCDGAPEIRSILLNSKIMFEGGRISDSGYQTMAHELMHPVIFASKFAASQNRCNTGKWISEGIPDAVSYYVIRRLRNLSLRSNYSQRLHDPDITQDSGRQDYFTSSFWRHLAEISYVEHASGGDHPGSIKARENYSYVASLLSQPLAQPGREGELAWLSKWMKRTPHVGQNLSRVFAQFAASFADHMSYRIPPLSTVPGSEREKKWLSKTFTDCPTIALSQEQPSVTKILQIEKVAARCFHVDTGSAASVPAELVIEEGSLSRSVLKGLRIGAFGGLLVRGPHIATGEAGTALADRTFALWSFAITTGERSSFIIANVDINPVQTEVATVALKFSVPYWESSLTGQEESAPVETSGQSAQPRTKEDVSRHVSAKQQNPTRRSLAAVRTGRNEKPPGPSCTSSMLQANQCGPQLGIALSKDNGAIPSIGFVGGSGGLINSAPASTESASAEALIQNYQTMVMQAEGEMISISVPLIDFGSTAGFGNARISVTKNIDGNESGSFEAMSPWPAANGGPDYNGQVTITEYTPHMLRGTFSAELIDSDDIGKMEPPYPVVSRVAGSFTVPAPWRGSAVKPDIGPDSAMMQDMRQDMITILQKMPMTMRQSMFDSGNLSKLCQMGFEDGELESLGITGSCGGTQGLAGNLVQTCSCVCNDFEQEHSILQCKRQCADNWQAQQCYGSAIIELDETDPEIENYMIEVRKLGMSEEANKAHHLSYQLSSSQLRAKMHQDIDRQVREKQKPAREGIVESPGLLDGETLRYESEIELFGLSPEIVADLVKNFQTSNDAGRAFLWQSLENMKKQKKF
jgi:hypothetical protein